MKRILSLFLVLVLLAGCAGQGGIRISDPVNIKLLQDTQWRMEIAAWSNLMYAISYGESFSTTLPNTGHMLTYDGEGFTLTDEKETHNYRHLVSSPWQDKSGYTECLILSNDPEMTAQKYKGPEDGIIILQHTLSFKLTPDQGDIPEIITQLESYGDVTFGKDGFYQLVSVGDGWSVNHYNYHGKLLSSTEGLSCRGSVLDLEDGGFVYICEEYSQNYYALECYDKNGTQRWTYRFPEKLQPYTRDLLEHDGKLYYFGYARSPSGCDDWYLYIFSNDGECLQETVYGGSDFDRISHVTKTEDGFTVYGETQSRDGDFPFSSDGYGQAFVAQLDAALQLKDAQKAEDDPFVDRIGWYQGKPAYGSLDDTAVPSQNVPDHVFTADGVFPYAEGYVVKHARSLGIPVMLDNPSFMSRTVTYTEVIYTGYTADGTPIWQYARVIA